MNFGAFSGHVPSASMPTIHQFAAKFGYEQERYQGAVQFAPDAKSRQESVVVAGAPGTVTLAGIAPLHTVSTGVKYQTLSTGTYTATYDKRERDDLPQDIMATLMQQQVTQAPLQQGTQLLVVLHEPKEAAARAVKQEARADRDALPAEYISIGDVSESWQLGGVAEYLSSLPLPLHQLLKDKREEPTPQPIAAATPVTTVAAQAPAPPKKKKKKKAAKEKKPKPKPGEIRLTTALDGSTLYCCPECHMAYPERGLLEQHLLGHTMERRFICDICNAALKRKDHLTRHKQSHNPERPHACSVCLKAFKRKEQLTLHFVIHSGEKRHVCGDCGKGFYRKDHLRKHTRSHIARRVKAELSQHEPRADPPPTPPEDAY